MADSLRETLTAAMSGADPGPAVADPAPIETGPVETTTSTPSLSARDAITGEPIATTESEAKAAKIATQPRGEDGKFAPKTPAEEGAQAAAPEPPTPVSEPAKAAGDKDPPSEEPVRVPASLPAPLKAKFKDLPDDVRAAFVKLDDDRTAAKAQWDQKAQQFNRLEEILAPRREAHRLNGLDDAQAIQVLFAAQDFLERDPIGGLNYLARSYGVDLRQLGQQLAQGQQPGGQPPPQLDAALQPIMQQVQTLQQKLEASEQAIQQAELQKGLSEVEAFRSKPENMYFDDVKDDIVVLLESGRAKDLADAYQKAVWASPEIRPLLIKAQTDADQQAKAKADAEAKAKADADARARADAARRAGGSVTGAPGAAVQAPGAGSKGNLREDLLAAMGAAQA